MSKAKLACLAAAIAIGAASIGAPTLALGGGGGGGGWHGGGGGMGIRSAAISGAGWHGAAWRGAAWHGAAWRGAACAVRLGAATSFRIAGLRFSTTVASLGRSSVCMLAAMGLVGLGSRHRRAGDMFGSAAQMATAITESLSTGVEMTPS